MTITTLASGSSGNCILVSHQGVRILVDAGISCRRIKNALAGLELTPGDLSGVLITHEHSDHISGLATLFKQYHLPVWCSKGTGRQLCCRIAFLEEVLHPFQAGDSFSIGGLCVSSFATLHDAADPVGYAFTDGAHKAAVVTDLGTVTSVVEQSIQGASLLVAEANHDPEMLLEGPYPYYLKERILGSHGHLSNEACAQLAARTGAKTIVLAHLSAENNRPDLALAAVRAAVDSSVTVEVAPRDRLGRTYRLEGAPVC